MDVIRSYTWRIRSGFLLLLRLLGSGYTLPTQGMRAIGNILRAYGGVGLWVLLTMGMGWHIAPAVGNPIPTALGNPQALVITPDGKRVYVTAGSGYVSVIDTATNTVVGDPIPAGSGHSQAMAITPDGKHIYVTNGSLQGTNTVSVIDTSTNTVVGNLIPVGDFPGGVAIPPAGGVRGRVATWPSCPVESNDQPCAPRPRAARVVVYEASGSRVATVDTGDTGQFELALAPGDYLIEAQAEGALCTPASVTVTPDRYVQVEITCDTGIR